MLKKIVITGVILSSAVLLSACKANVTTSNNGSQSPTTSSQSSTGEGTAQGAATITASDSGFSPATVTIKAGESITWVNNSSKEVQVGSAKHPTHTENPELTGGEFVIKLAPGESKTVSAGAKVGTWGYHDHLNSTAFGKVTIQ